MKIVIIGAGVAGLSVANSLIDLGISSTLIEASSIGREKITGEFFSGESLPVLKKWGVPLVVFNTGVFSTTSQSFKFDFKDKKPGSVSHALCEKILASRATELGVDLLENSPVLDIVYSPKNQSYSLVLENKKIEADILVLASGRAPGLVKKNLSLNNARYIGLKAHFSKVHRREDQLEFYIVDGGYFGVTAIEDSKTNITCLLPSCLFSIDLEVSENLNQLFSKFPDLFNRLNRAQMLFHGWAKTPVFGFGEKQLPNWQNAYFIGDAAATIYPVSGNGLSMGITSGVMAAEHIYKKYYLKQEQKKYYALWKENYSSRLKWAEVLHNIFIRPKLLTFGFKIANRWPAIAQFFYNRTREKENI